MRAFRQFVKAAAGWANVFAVDLRNHGESPVGELAAHTQTRLRLDLIEVLHFLDTEFGKHPTYGLFHSISGLYALNAELCDPGRFEGLVLLEPPVSPPRGHVLYEQQIAAQDGLAAGTLKRRDQFASAHALVERLRDRSQFRYLSAQALEDYCEGILRRTGPVWTLRCPKSFEAQGYTQNLDDGFFAKLREIAIPVLLVASAEPGFRHSLTEALMAEMGFDGCFLDGVTHLMPLEKPEEIAALARDYLIRV